MQIDYSLVQLTAYYLWLKTGYDDLTCWLTAEHEVTVRNQAARIKINTGSCRWKEQIAQRVKDNEAVRREYSLKGTKK